MDDGERNGRSESKNNIFCRLTSSSPVGALSSLDDRNRVILFQPDRDTSDVSDMVLARGNPRPLPGQFIRESRVRIPIGQKHLQLSRGQVRGTRFDSFLGKGREKKILMQWRDISL